MCRDFAPAYMGDLLVLAEDWYDESLDRYTMLAELVAVKDECAGAKRRFIWKFDNLRPIEPVPGVRQRGVVGRVHASVIFSHFIPHAAERSMP